jgi:hypothetical protein
MAEKALSCALHLGLPGKAIASVATTVVGDEPAA